MYKLLRKTFLLFFLIIRKLDLIIIYSYTTRNYLSENPIFIFILKITKTKNDSVIF